MEKLKALYESLGFKKVSTYIQSGNVVFECRETSLAELAGKIDVKIEEAFGFDVAVIIRTRQEMERVVKDNPFNVENLYVTFLSSLPAEKPSERIRMAKAPEEDIKLSGMEVYLRCPKGYGRTKLSNNFLESKLKTSATTRNWNTVLKLAVIAAQP